jgi:transposase
MADNDSNHVQSTPQPAQLTPAEMRGLAARLRARAQSVLLRDQPEQQRDLRAAADLIDRLVHLLAEIRRLADEVRDEVEQQHLRHLLEGGAS